MWTVGAATPAAAWGVPQVVEEPTVAAAATVTAALWAAAWTVLAAAAVAE